ncbi:MAG: GDSL-type esterase/lipase family protein, partial [Verrucomicrobiota bacterium]
RSTPPQFQFHIPQNGDFFYTNTPSTKIEFVYDGNPRGYFEEGNLVSHKTNSLGFRGDEFTIPKSSQLVRITALGDSFTFGEGVKDEDTYAEKLEALLQDQEDDAREFEVYNFGVGGFNTEQAVRLFEDLVIQVNPDHVVLGYTLNDAEPKLFVLDQAAQEIRRRERSVEAIESIYALEQSSGFLSRLKIVQLIQQILNKEKMTRATVEYYKALYKEKNADWSKTQASFKRLSELCQQKEIECTVLVFPLLYDLSEDYPFIAIHEKIRKEAEMNGLNVVDLFPALKGMDHTSLWVHPTDQHPNEIVHQIAADALFQSIFRNTEF